MTRMTRRGAVAFGLLLAPGSAMAQSVEDSVAVVRLAAAHASLELFEGFVTDLCVATRPGVVYPSLLLGGIDESAESLPAAALTASLLRESRTVLGETTGRRLTDCGRVCGTACVRVSLQAPVFESPGSALTSISTLRDGHSIHTLCRFVKKDGRWEMAGRCGGLRMLHQSAAATQPPPPRVQPTAPCRP